MRWWGCLNGGSEGKGVYVGYNSRNYENLKTNKREWVRISKGV